MKTRLTVAAIISILILTAASNLIVAAQKTISKTVGAYFPLPNKNGGEPQELTGVIRIPKEFGVVPSGPSSPIASPSPCIHFIVAVMDPDNKNKVVTYTDKALEPGRDDATFYTCKYSISFPRDKQFYVVASMGDLSQFNNMKRYKWYWSDTWVGGTNNKPRRGYERSFTGKYITLGVKPMYLRFDLSYVQVDPN